MDQPITPTRPVFTQTPVEPEPAKKSYTWLIVIIIIFLLAGSSILAYKYYQLKQQLTQTQPSLSSTATPMPSADPTADWKTYTNVLYKFSHKYPLQAEIKEILTQADNNRKVLFAIDTREVGATQKLNTEFYDGYSFTVIVVEKSATETINNVSNEYISNCIEIGNLTKSPESIIINGIKGITHSCRGLGEFTYILLPAPKTNSYYFTIRIFHEGPNKTDYQKTADQILSTFKFID